MGVHPVRWLGGGALLGPGDPPPECYDCAVFIGWDAADIYCPGCRARRDEADRKRVEAEQRERDEAEQDGGLYWSGGWWNGDD